MSKLAPFTVRQFKNEWQISSLLEAQAMSARLLQQPQFEADAELGRIAGMIEQAIAGHQTPTAAYNAFAQFAIGRGLVAAKPKSAAWEEFSKSIGKSHR